LAGLLVKTGYDIIDLAYLKRAHKGPRWDLALMMLVVLLTVFVDLITAVLAGVVMAALAFVKQIADAQLKALGDVTNEGLSVDLTEEEEALLKRAGNKITLFDFGGPLSFGAAADVGHQVREKSKGKSAMILDFSRVTHVDVSAARAMETIGSDAHAANKEVYVSGMNDEVRTMLKGLNNEYCLSHGDNFATRLDAIKDAVEFVEEEDASAASAAGTKAAPSTA
jgi:SulP family sulfate permease